ncbi:MAG TPA: FAD-binding oxidoreductase [Candidatus Solibacter sp.]|jgi:FAD/FMN-containing dehydrogenase|nr:FAD-binding oxidoreductase [Candidatus Solibacter sp.]
MNAAPSDLNLPPGTIFPSDPDYDQARRVWNGTIDRRPAAVVRCTTVDDVIATVRAAAKAGIPLAVRGGGHSVPGFSTCDDGIVLDLASMSSVDVDPDARVAGVGGGATWGMVDAETERFGLATTGGLVSTTGVGGLTLGGGIGWLTRRCGLACDNLLSAEVVTATGEVVRAGGDGDQELLWGLRGGGGNFGVATSFEFRLTPLQSVFGGIALFHMARARDVFTFYRDWVGTIPDELTPMLVFLEGPDGEPIPPELRGQPVIAIVACHMAEPEVAMADLRPIEDLRPELFAYESMPYTAMQQMFDADVPAGDRYYFKGGFGAAYPDEMIEVLVEHFSRRPGSRCEVDLHHMGGAASRVGEMETAFPGRSALITSNVYGCWTDPHDDEAQRNWVRALSTELDRFGTGGDYVNFMSEVESANAQTAYGDERLSRLRELKRRYDPTNLFQLNQNITP